MMYIVSYNYMCDLKDFGTNFVKLFYVIIASVKTILKYAKSGENYVKKITIIVTPRLKCYKTFYIHNL